MAKDLYDMDDEELEEAFRAAKEELASGVNSFEESEDTSDTEDYQEDDDNNTDEDTDEDQSSEEDENDGAEQPGDVQDSDTGVNDDDSTEDQPAGKESASDDQPAGDSEEDKSLKVRKFKADGKEYEFTQEEIDTQFPKIFAQAMNYTKKMQAIAPWRKTIDAIEQAKLSHDDVNLMIDVLKGDKGAISEVLKRTGTDTLDLNPEEPAYIPNDYGRDGRTLAIHDVLDSIKHDPEYAVTQRILNSDWDEASWNALASNPENIRLLHIDVKSGEYGILQPRAEKLKVLDGYRRTDLEYYMEAARSYYQEKATLEAQQRNAQELTARTEAAVQQRIADAKAQGQQRTAAQQASKQRKAAAPSAPRAAAPKVVDYLDASDEEFEEWYKRINNE